MFRLRVEPRAYLVAVGEYDFHESIERMQAAAQQYGLDRALGMDGVQRILATAFRGVLR